MKSRKNQIILGAILALALAILVLAGIYWGVSSFKFWLAVFVSLGLPAIFIYVYWRSRQANEIIKCSNCGRTMIYSVFQKAGSCPKCHSNSYIRTGTWP
jgi:energy-coupling factor transporter transmembrane protein EcfT